MKDIADKFIELADSKKKHDDARLFFLKQIEGEYNPLLWKCYLSHMKERNDNFEKKERIALLGSSNIIPMKDMLQSVFNANKISTDYYVGEYGNYLQELMRDASKLYSFGPTLTIIMLSLPDIVPSIYEDPFSCDKKDVESLLAKISEDLKAALKKYSSAAAKNTTYMAIIPSYEEPCSYVYSPGHSFRSDTYLTKLRDVIEWLENEKNNIVMINARKCISKYPANKAEDKRYWYLGRISYTDMFFSEMAKEVMEIYKIMNTPSKKCLILDLDNTLWGGVIGQDGIEKIALGQDGIGRAYQDLQREVLKLYKKGIILAICSKNNEADALEFFKTHAEMILKLEHFAAKRINWADKAANIKEIAQDINIGLDSIVFFDDDPAERKWVRGSLPQVTVPEPPQDQFLYGEFIKNSKWFNSYRLSEEDLSRNVTYEAVAKTKSLKTSSGNEEAFLKSLSQSVILEGVNPSTISRTAQLCQKTNQFNLTTKRYQAADIKEIMAHKSNHVYTIRAKDCFCDYGVVGALILKEQKKDGSVLIDTFLLSCRIIGRKIEHALLSWLKSRFKANGYSKIYGSYSRTEKNGVCANIYKENNFTVVSESDKGTLYEYSLNKKQKLSSFDRFIKVKLKKK